MSDRVVCIVQARMGSSRLPGKALMALAGNPLILHVLARAQAIRGVDRVVLATSDTMREEPLMHLASQYVPVVTGSEWDVLARMQKAATLHEADIVMRVTGDCPFLAPEVAREVLAHYRSNPLEAAYVSNDTTCSGYPDGTDVEVFSAAALNTAYQKATDRYDREHVTPWMRRMMLNGYIKNAVDYSRYKLSVDSPQDYEFATQVAGKLIVSGKEPDYSLGATMRAVREVLGES